MKPFRATSHAINRYIQRIDKCSRKAAADRLTHAAEIAVPATREQIAASRSGPAPIRLYCEVESLLLICASEPNAIVILTVYRTIGPEDARRQNAARKKRISSGKKSRRRLCREVS